MDPTHTEQQQPLLENTEEQEQMKNEQPEVEERRPVVLFKGVPQKEATQLQCEIHKGLLHDPVGTGKCKHVFCRACLASWVELQGHCPLDSRPAQVDQFVTAEPAAKKLNNLLIHCRWGVVQNDEGIWEVAQGPGYCPALITIGDRKAHEDCCAYRPQDESNASHNVVARQLMNKLQLSQMQINVDQAMQNLRANLSRFERVLAERLEVLLGQVRNLIEEQNVQRLRAGASGAMKNFKEEMEAAIASLIEKQAPLFRNIAAKSDSLYTEARDVAREKGSALYAGAVQMGNQAAAAGSDALGRLDILAQELMGEVKLALMRSVEPETCCPTPPPPPPPDRVFEDQEQEEQEEEAVHHIAPPASVSVEDVEWDDCPSWIPAQPTLRQPPPVPPRTRVTKQD